MLQVKNKPDELFQAYVSSFPKVSDEQFAITINDVGLKDHRRSVGYEFVQFIPEMENTSFGRDVSHDFIYVANVRETPFYYAAKNCNPCTLSSPLMITRARLLLSNY
jgi:hypothetical protein